MGPLEELRIARAVVARYRAGASAKKEFGRESPAGEFVLFFAKKSKLLSVTP